MTKRVENTDKFNQCFINTVKTLMKNIGKLNKNFLKNFLKTQMNIFFINESTLEEIMDSS